MLGKIALKCLAYENAHSLNENPQVTKIRSVFKAAITQGALQLNEAIRSSLFKTFLKDKKLGSILETKVLYLEAHISMMIADGMGEDPSLTRSLVEGLLDISLEPNQKSDSAARSKALNEAVMKSLKEPDAEERIPMAVRDIKLRALSDDEF